MVRQLSATLQLFNFLTLLPFPSLSRQNLFHYPRRHRQARGAPLSGSHRPAIGASEQAGDRQVFVKLRPVQGDAPAADFAPGPLRIQPGEPGQRRPRMRPSVSVTHSMSGSHRTDFASAAVGTCARGCLGRLPVEVLMPGLQ